ncbi:hypothetical protein [Roseicyclus elongatus]|uniref:hypothetical protein n=1 Tax=Roseicyclus elongatus TaxID=159346 RepID=UPI0012EB967A|nr:hypothetical protein [Roseibacterium elongatum]
MPDQNQFAHTKSLFQILRPVMGDRAAKRKATSAKAESALQDRQKGRRGKAHYGADGKPHERAPEARRRKAEQGANRGIEGKGRHIHGLDATTIGCQ